MFIDYESMHNYLLKVCNIEDEQKIPLYCAPGKPNEVTSDVGNHRVPDPCQGTELTHNQTQLCVEYIECINYIFN